MLHTPGPESRGSATACLADRARSGSGRRPRALGLLAAPGPWPRSPGRVARPLARARPRVGPRFGAGAARRRRRSRLESGADRKLNDGRARRWENPLPLQRELPGRLQDSAWVEALSPQVTKPSRTTLPPEAALGTPRRDVPSERGREERSASSLRVESSLLLRKRVSARGPHRGRNGTALGWEFRQQ